MPELRDIADITDGTHYTPRDVGAGIPFLTVKDMTTEGLAFDTSSRITEEDYAVAVKANSAPRVGDVLFSKDGTVGKVHVVVEDRPFAVLSSIAIVRPNQHRVDPRYLAWALRDPSVLSAAEKTKTGSAVRRIILSDLKRLRIGLPPLPEQRRIAAILDQADELRAKRRRGLLAVSKLRGAILLAALAGSTGVTRLGELAGLITKGTTPSSLGFGYVSQGVPFLRAQNVIDGSVSMLTDQLYVTDEVDHALARSRIQSGDVLVTIAGTVGRAGLVPENSGPMNCNQAVAIVRPRRREQGAFIVDWLASEEAQQHVTRSSVTATISNLSLRQLADIEVPVPSEAALARFNKQSQGLADLAAGARRHESRLDELFASLQHRAFAGCL